LNLFLPAKESVPQVIPGQHSSAVTVVAKTDVRLFSAQSGELNVLLHFFKKIKKHLNM
jgi:hypothetical protein